MSYKALDLQQVFRLLGGGQTINISTISKDGVYDVMTAAWNTLYNMDEPLVVLDRNHTTSQNILDTHKYVIALPNKELIASLKKVGSAHGRDVGDKFKWAGITPEFTKSFHLPIIPGSLAYFECELSMEKIFNETGILVGKCVNAMVLEGLYDFERNVFDPGIKQLLHSLDEANFLSGGEYFH